MKGFLLTCNNREKECVREAYNILNEHADAIYGLEQKETEDPIASDEEEDIDSALKKQVENIKTASRADRRFQNINSGAKNCVFIKSSLKNPDKIVHSIMQNVVDNKSSKARFICRFLPVVDSCPARMETILKTVETVYDSFCADVGSDEHSFCVVPKIRNQNTLSSNVLKSDISQMLKEKNCLNKVDYSNAEVVILVEVIRNVCCVSVVRDFFKFRKYNLMEVQLQGYAEEKKPKTEEENGNSQDDKPTDDLEENVDNKITENPDESIDKNTSQEECKVEEGDVAKIEEPIDGTLIAEDDGEKSMKRKLDDSELAAETGSSPKVQKSDCTSADIPS